MDFRYSDQAGNLTESTFTDDIAVKAPVAPDLTPKRVFDIVAASLGLAFVSPLLLLTALLIRLQDGKKALYSQPRYGLNGEAFQCFKLRSMVPDADKKLQAVLDSDPAARLEWDRTQKLTNDPRVTTLGKIIRSLSIDELPQLMNIIRGDMSVVGPRPIPLYERSKYGEDFIHYCSVRPGLTGLWQTSGRSNTTYAERIELDKKYVETQSFWGDFMIILKTFPAVILSIGAK
jgi:exopolysaccharide production protein ExoY